jgi:hypothetical protein
LWVRINLDDEEYRTPVYDADVTGSVVEAEAANGGSFQIPSAMRSRILVMAIAADRSASA